MKYYLIILLSVIGLAINFVLTKIYQNRTGTALRVSVLYNIFSGVCSTLVFFCLNGFRFPITPFSLLLALLMTLLSGTYVILGFQLISMGNLSVYSLFLMLGGMILPYFFGLVFLDEAFSLLRVIGLVLMIISILLSGIEPRPRTKNGIKFRHHKGYFPLCIAVFVLNGCVSIVAKAHQLPEHADIAISATEFVMLIAAIKVIIFSVFYAILRFRDRKAPKPQTPTRPPFTLAVFLIIFAAALVDGLSCIGQLTGAAHLPATVLFPLVTGSSVVLSALAGWIVFGECPGKRATAGILLCFIATFFFL